MKPHVKLVPHHRLFPGEFVCSTSGSSIYGTGASIPEAIEAWERRGKALGWSEGIPPTTEPERPRHRSWQTLWLALLVACMLAAFGLYSQRAQAYDLQKCEWLDNSAYSQAWLRDAGVTRAQLKIMIRKSDETSAAQVGLIALSKYVYAHPEMSPDQLADDVSRECRSYDE